MKRIGENAARVFKTLAGQDRDAPLSAAVFALYSFLLMVGMFIVAAWMTSA